MIVLNLFEVIKHAGEIILLFFKRLIAKIHRLFYASFLFHGQRTSVYPPFRFRNLSRIKIGSKCTIHENCWIQVLDSAKKIRPRLISIGNYVALGMDSTLSAAERIIIEDHVFTARNVYISDHEHEYRDIARPIGDSGNQQNCRGENRRGDLDRAKCGYFPGVTIGRHCVIGAKCSRQLRHP